MLRFDLVVLTHHWILLLARFFSHLSISLWNANVIRFLRIRKLRNNELGRLSPEEFAKASKTPLVVVLDNIRSMHNVGSIFRTADCFLAQHIFLCGLTPEPVHHEIEKTALGATQTVSWSKEESTVTCLNNLKCKGYRIVALEQAEGSIDLR